MSFKTKFLNIITFGHISRKAKKEAAKREENKSDTLTLNTIQLPDISVLINAFGGIENIEQITNTISTVTFKIIDFNKVDLEQLKDISKRGIIRSKDSITFIVGDCAQKLKEEVDKYKNK